MTIPNLLFLFPLKPSKRSIFFIRHSLKDLLKDQVKKFQNQTFKDQGFKLSLQGTIKLNLVAGFRTGGALHSALNWLSVGTKLSLT